MTPLEVQYLESASKLLITEQFNGLIFPGEEVYEVARAFEGNLASNKNIMRCLLAEATEPTLIGIDKRQKAKLIKQELYHNTLKLRDFMEALIDN